LLKRQRQLQPIPGYYFIAIGADSRGICVDDETIRMIQGLGLNDKVYSEIGFTPTCFYFHPGDHDLYSPPVFKGRWDRYIGLNIGNCEAEAGHAHKGSLFHEQPMLGLSHLASTDDREECPQCF
jgi:hypothetical protein